MDEQARGQHATVTIPDRWSVGLDGQPAQRHVPTKPIRTIAVQYDVFGVGGAERVAQEQLKYLLELGYRPILYTNVPQAEGDLTVPDGVVRKWAPSENDDHEKRFAFWKNEVEVEGIDLCLYNSWVSGWMQFDCWAFAQLGVSFIMYCHSMFASWFGDDTADYLARALPWAAERSTAIICTNEASASFFSIYSDRVLMLPNPLRPYLQDVDATRNPEGKTIVWVGRMTSEKRPSDVVEIMKRVVDHHPDARMVVVGGDDSTDVPQPETLEAQAKYCGMNSAITFTGVTSPYSYLAKASVYVQTSEYEGFSLSLAEAMYFSLPCVTYNYDYLPHVKGNEGIVCAPVGDVDAMAKAICMILEDEERANEMGRQCRAAYDKLAAFDLTNAYKRLVEGVEADSVPADMLYVRADHAVDEKRMSDYFLQGVKLACDERHRILWNGWEQLDRANERIKRLERDIAALRSELDEVMNSQSFKLGNAIAAPYRLVSSHVRHEK